MDLFENASEQDSARRAPLAERMRPHTLDEVVGQEHLTGPTRFLRRALENEQVPSLIFWGPPGTGKTTLARVIAGATGAAFHALSAVGAGVKDIREVVSQAQERWKMHRQRTILFIDEIHRFNKAQQDALLPHVEKGTITLLGATTENPSFEVIAALLSRSRVVVLRPLEDDELERVLRHALEDVRGYGGKVRVEDEALKLIARAAGGDARKALNGLEAAVQYAQGEVTRAKAEEALQQKTLLYDKAGDEHYNVVSAFIKSMRGSDADAALYWMTRMLEAGEDPMFVLRRMVIFASEDIGNADPRALSVAVDALRSFQLVGMPEGTLPLTQAVSYLAMAPKSNTVLTSYASVREAVMDAGPLPVPLHLRNAPTPMMKSMGYGSAYKYPHNYEGNYVPEQYLPDQLRGRRFYAPSQSGFERDLSERLSEIRKRQEVAEIAGEPPGASGTSRSR